MPITLSDATSHSQPLKLETCAEFSNNWNGNSSTYSEPYAQAEIDELLAFGATMARAPSSAGAETYRALQKRQQESPGSAKPPH